MRIVQLLSVISFGDAVSNDARAIAGILTENGFENEIYAEHVDNRLPRGTAHALDGGLHLSPEDLLIYHASTGTQLNFDLPSFGGKQVMIYHNITPREFFHGYNTEAEQNMRYGYEGVRFLADKMRYCIADSDYNRQQLRQIPVQRCFAFFDPLQHEQYRHQLCHRGHRPLLVGVLFKDHRAGIHLRQKTARRVQRHGRRALQGLRVRSGEQKNPRQQKGGDHFTQCLHTIPPASGR